MDADGSTDRTLALQESLEKFIKTVDDLKNEDDPSGDGFTREFRIIRDDGIRMREENTFPALEGKKPCNIKKNRYKDILPFDETRVKLQEIEGEEGSDYINANFIKDQIGNKSYIGCQGPLPHTVNDFWRMIWEQRVKVIAMACRLVEMGKKKCEQYWPDEINEPTMFGDISVTKISEKDLAEHCTQREMVLEKDGESLMVTQFHYTGWPDHDIPNDFDVILEMMANMRKIKSKDQEKAPYAIHCSAGCGRTGTIVAIDYAWDVLKSGNLTKDFNLFQIVKTLRTQRQSMIQAPEQYMMAHVTVQQLFQKHLELMEDHTYGNFTFGNAEGEYADLADTGSELSAPDSVNRKNSSLQQEIESTLYSSVNPVPLKKDPVPPPSPKEKTKEPKSPNVQEQINKFKVLDISGGSFDIETPEQARPTEMLKPQRSESFKKKQATINGAIAPQPLPTKVENIYKGGKYATQISIGGTPKPAVKQSVSSPHPGMAASAASSASSRAKTLPAQQRESPQSSIPPVTPTKPGESLYSFAKEDNSYSALANYSSADISKPHTNQKPPPKAKPQLSPKSPAASNVYSYAQNIPEPSRDEYAVVSKVKRPEPDKNGANTTYSSVYEAVSVGDQGSMGAPPVLPDRNYLEPETEKTDAVESTTHGKKPFTALKNLFTSGSKGTITNSDNVGSSDIPAYKVRIGKRPSGPRAEPTSWSQRL